MKSLLISVVQNSNEPHGAFAGSMMRVTKSWMSAPSMPPSTLASPLQHIGSIPQGLLEQSEPMPPNEYADPRAAHSAARVGSQV